MVSINDLPEEVLDYILGLLSPYWDLKACRQVCHRWHDSCRNVCIKRKAKFHLALRSGIVKWDKIVESPASRCIPRRYSHCSCLHGTYVYVFGGCTHTFTTFNDLWGFDLGCHKWERLLTLGDYPSPKAYATLISWENFLVLFGGWTYPAGFPLHQQCILFDELHFYSLVDNRWNQIKCLFGPPPLAGHTCTVHDDLMIIFGGLARMANGATVCTNRIFYFDLINKEWHEPDVGEPLPEPRYGHSQVKIDNKHLLIIGGCNGTNRLYSDVWLLSIPENPCSKCTKWIWKKVIISNEHCMPPQVSCNIACKVENEIVVFSTLNIPEVTSTPSRNMAYYFIPRFFPYQVMDDNSDNEARNLVNVNNRLDRAFALFIGNQRNNAAGDVNVNGQRGHLVNPSFENDLPRVGPERRNLRIRPNASCDHQRRLQAIAKMEEKLHQCEEALKSRLQEKVKVAEMRRSSIVPYILDISDVVTSNVVTWLPAPTLDCLANTKGEPPSSTLLYSLVVGRGNLILFGGIYQLNDKHVISNTVSILSAPCNSC